MYLLFSVCWENMREAKGFSQRENQAQREVGMVADSTTKYYASLQLPEAQHRPPKWKAQICGDSLQTAGLDKA